MVLKSYPVSIASEPWVDGRERRALEMVPVVRI
jgi:hypothetical protein